MRKVLLIGLVIVFSCAIYKSEPIATAKGSSLDYLKLSLQTDSKTQNSNDVKNNNINTEAVNNKYFFKDNVTQLVYRGQFLFDDILEKEIKLDIHEVANLKYGKLYNFKINYIEGVPNERLDLGYFYIQEDKIYKIKSNEEDLKKLKTTEEIPNDSVIVCQEKEIKDTLGKDEIGFHHYLKVNGDKREYHSYNNQVSTGYYESFIWEKDKGLVTYRSGFGAERDSIELQLQNN
jgi:hypothetical protein